MDNNAVMARVSTVFSIHERERVRERLLSMARTDARVVAAAAVGSLAVDEGDDWSDLDLMFAVSDNDLSDVVESWTQIVIADLVAVHLFDLTSGPTLYRVFLLPDGLELDLSFVPASEFRPGGPKFKLLFGEALERKEEPPADAEELFGYAVHHVLHARAAIERGRYWQAEYWISAVRDHALMLACLSRGLEGSYGRDFDRLPVDVRDLATASLVGSPTREELDRALGTAVAALLRESGPAGEMVEKVSAQLHQAASGRAI
jgi:predicted nucleotidyltransferase